MKILLQLNHLNKSYGEKKILSDATCSLAEKKKIGVIGRNGAGKSTLFRILTGEEEADSGEVIRNGDLCLGYLAQHDSHEAGETVLDFLVRDSGREEWECGKIAGRFQLKNERLYGRIEDLSGGYRMRVKLAAMLLKEPNFLLLDEPTNYLDLDTLLLLEDFLRDFNGGFVIISHDREFLKNTCENTLELESGEVFLYPGDVEEYLAFKAERIRQATAFNKNVSARRNELQTFIDRFHAKASKASQARSKQKQLDRMHHIEIGQPLSNVRIRIPSAPPRKGPVLKCEALDIGYDSLLVARDINLHLKRGVHAAVLGTNGQGKTTLLRTLAGEIPLRQGNFSWNDTDIGYYAQHVYATLGDEGDVLAYLERIAGETVSRQEILDLAAGFLFRGDELRKSLVALSGGERARLCLAGLLLQKNQVLLLDEPTNHLDFETVEVLGAALKEFTGTLFFVSHDRTFVNLVATEIIEVRDGQVELFPGIYEDYVYRLHSRMNEEGNGVNPSKVAMKVGVTVNAKTNAKAQKQSDGSESAKFENEAAKPINVYQERKQGRAELARLRKDLAAGEKNLAKLEKEKADLLIFFTENSDKYEPEKNARLQELEELIVREENDWLRLQSAIEIAGPSL